MSWSRGCTIREVLGVRFMIAGGLNAENVGRAVAALDPDGVDTASGIERDGRVDGSRMLEFCRAAREAGRAR
jgi:phosphoribosylanthranilate isomerase